MSREARSTPDRIPGLDGLRAVAVLLVFYHHVDQEAFPGGRFGVDVFFVLSGFLISAILMRELRSTGTIAFKAFYRRRAFRLWPALVTVAVVTVPLAAWRGFGHPIPDALVALLYGTNVYAVAFPHFSLLLHTWSLAAEEQFYLVWPTLLYWGSRGKARWSAIGSGVAVTALVLTIATVHVQNAQFLPWVHAWSFAAGIGVAFAPQSSIVRFCGSPFSLVAFAAVLVGESMLSASFGLWAYVLFVPALASPVCHILSRGSGVAVRALESPGLVWLGERSYGFYLWHYPVIFVGYDLGVSGLLMSTLGLVVTALLSAVMWRVVEQPFNRRRNRPAKVSLSS